MLRHFIAKYDVSKGLLHNAMGRFFKPMIPKARLCLQDLLPSSTSVSINIQFSIHSNCSRFWF
jgi:hypothetical protein